MWLEKGAVLKNVLGGRGQMTYLEAGRVCLVNQR